MKTVLHAAFLALALGMGMPTAHAAQWVYVAQSDELTVWSIDRASIRSRGHLSALWVKETYADGSYALHLVYFNFANYTYTSAISILCHPDGTVADRYDIHPSVRRWEPIVPETILAITYSRLAQIRGLRGH